MTEKFKAIIDNHTNGNLTDFKAGLKKLSKVQLMDLMVYWNFLTNESYTNIISHITFGLN